MLKTGENTFTVEDCEDSDEEKQREQKEQQQQQLKQQQQQQQQRQLQQQQQQLKQQQQQQLKQQQRQQQQQLQQLQRQQQKKKVSVPIQIRAAQNPNSYGATTKTQLGRQAAAQLLYGQTVRMPQVASAAPIFGELPYAPWQYQQPRPRPKARPKARWQQSHGRKERQHGPRPGASNQWYTLSSRMHKHGTTIEMMYTGVTVPQPTQLLNIRAIPGVTHMTMELPAGVLPNVRSSTPDMPCLMNAMNFFRNPDEHLPDPNMGPPTIIHVTPKSQSQQQCSDCIEIVPLNCERAAPLKRKCLNTGFQSYSMMQMEVDENNSMQPGRLVLDADISPMYLLNTHQQLRLQSAIQQEGVSLTEALLPIANDLYEEHEKLRQAGFAILPAPMPLPYGTMQFHYNQKFNPLAKAFAMHGPERLANLVAQPKVPQPKAPQPKVPQPKPPQPKVPQPKPPQPKAPQSKAPLIQMRSQPKKIPAPRWRSGSTVNLSGTIMALDRHGNYHPMLYSDWENMKKEQLQRQQSKQMRALHCFAGVQRR